MTEKLTRAGARADELEPSGAEAYLPEYVDRLTGDTTASVHFGEFTDTGTPGPDGWAVDGGEVSRLGDTWGLHLMKDTDDTFQRGVYYYLDAVRDDGSFLAQIEAIPILGEPFKASYTLDPDFTGFVGGIIHGPTQKALIFLLRGDYASGVPGVPPCDFEFGYTKFYLDICSPSQDGSGTRTVHGTLEFDPQVAQFDMGGGVVGCSGWPVCYLSIGVRWDATGDEVLVSLAGGTPNMSGPGGEITGRVEERIDLGDIDTVLPGMTFGGVDWSESFQKVGVFAGLDAKDADTTLGLTTCGVGSLTKKRMASGQPAAGTTYVQRPSCLTEFRGRLTSPEQLVEELDRGLSFLGTYKTLAQDLEVSSGDQNQLLLVSSPLGLHFHADYATAAYWGEVFPAPFFDEPFPGKGTWRIASQYPRLTVSLKLGEFLHPRSANTGWGIVFPITVLEGDTSAEGYEPTTKSVELYLFDDFEEKYLALYTPDPLHPGRDREANFTRLSGSWEENSTLELTIVVHPLSFSGRPPPPAVYAVSVYDDEWTLLGTVYLYEPEAWPTPPLEPLVPDLDTDVFPVATGDFIGVGRLLDPSEISSLYADETFVGDMYLSHWRCLPSSLSYLPDVMNGTAMPPDQMGWERLFFGGNYSVDNESVVIEDTSYTGGIWGEGFTGYMYKGWSGGGGGVRSTMTGRLKINSWTDTIGTPNPTNTPISAGHFISDGQRVAYTAFVDTGTKKYVFIPGPDIEQSVADVIAQNTDGRAISTEVDFAEYHSYTLAHQDDFGISLYIDDAHDPIIKISKTLLPEPGDLRLIDEGWAPSKFKGVGSWDVTRAATLELLEWAYGASIGYDLVMQRSAGDDELALIEGNLTITVVEFEEGHGPPGP